LKKGRIHIGLSGFSYHSWVGNFYPESIKPAEYFFYYLWHFKSLELNVSFYHLPSAEIFEKWGNMVAEDFIFSVKAPRFITHNKKLKLPNMLFEPLFERASKLGKHLGPILFQLPPKWKCNEERLKDFLKALPKGYRFTFEFRNPTWYNEKIYDLLREHNAAFCIYQLAGHQSPKEVTADFVYIRLHGPTNQKYVGNYTDRRLQPWADMLLEWKSESMDSYVYFDNTDDKGHAAFNALSLMELVKEEN
jgi:uncharacterized protein YecE (DUF72 family)